MKLVHEMTRERLGGHHSAKSVMVSVDFADIQPLTERGDWDGLLIRQDQGRMPLFDTTIIHARVAVDQALGG